MPDKELFERWWKAWVGAHRPMAGARPEKYLKDVAREAFAAALRERIDVRGCGDNEQELTYREKQVEVLQADNAALRAERDEALRKVKEGQVLADEKCKWFLVRAEAAERQVAELREQKQECHCTECWLKKHEGSTSEQMRDALAHAKKER